MNQGLRGQVDDAECRRDKPEGFDEVSGAIVGCAVHAGVVCVSVSGRVCGGFSMLSER